MDLILRALTDDDAPALQQLYDEAPAAFTRILGRPAPAGQAARDLAQTRATPGRYSFGAILDGQLVGLVDCKLAEDLPGLARIGLLLVADRHAGPQLATLMLRIVTRWLRDSLGVNRLETAIPAQDPDELAFWQAQGFVLTGQQYRQTFENFHPRFLVMARPDILD